LSYESFEVAQDEINRSIKALRAIKREMKYLCNSRVDRISSFLPINLPLYSLVLFGIVPSFMAKKVYMRPPKPMWSIFKKLTFFLKPVIPPPIEFQYCERKYFLELFIKKSDVIIFTGRYENALSVQRETVPFRSLFIYNGRGINPLLITPNADLNLAVSKCIKVRCFNSGQDCAGPDDIIVHNSIIDPFIEKLIEKLNSLEVKSDYYSGNIIGPIVKTEGLLELQKFFKENKSKIIYGGSVDLTNKICYPTVLVSNLMQHSDYTQEFFAPVFNVLIYSNAEDLDFYFQNKDYFDYAMYVSVFGDSPYISKLKRHSIVLQNLTILEIDQNTFGGYGRRASYVSYYGFIFPRPILISKEIWRYVKVLKKLDKNAI